MPAPDELPVPENVLNGESVEVIRAWISRGMVHASLNVGMWENDPHMSEHQAWAKIFAELIEMIGGAASDSEENRQIFIRSLITELNSEIDVGRMQPGRFVDE